MLTILLAVFLLITVAWALHDSRTVVERHKEMLVAADAAVVRLRNRLLDSVRLYQAGKDPLGVNIEDYSEVRSLADTNVREGERWQNLLPNNMGSGVRIAAPAMACAN